MKTYAAEAAGAALFILTLVACGAFESNYENYGKEDGIGIEPTTASVQKDLANEYCVRCHRPQGDPPNLTSLKRHIAEGAQGKGSVLVPGQPQASSLYQMLARNAMPPPTVPQPPDGTTDVVREWIVSLKKGEPKGKP